MIKKVTIIFLSVFYLVFASGFILNSHYCGGKLKKTSLFASNENGCCGSKKKSKGCCKDKTTVIKVQENHQATKVAQVNNPTTHLVALVSQQLLFIINCCGEVKVASNYHAPPVIYDNPLYLKHRVLLI